MFALNNINVNIITINGLSQVISFFFFMSFKNVLIRAGDVA
jgi:hypothetical protein